MDSRTAFIAASTAIGAAVGAYHAFHSLRELEQGGGSVETITLDNWLADSDSPSKLDVVFVHGLNGGPKSTWTAPVEQKSTTAPESSAKPVFWPTELLGAESDPALKNARILTFGYPNRITWLFGSGAAPLVARAHTLLNSLSALDVGSKPVIFITHSMVCASRCAAPAESLFARRAVCW